MMAAWTVNQGFVSKEAEGREGKDGEKKIKDNTPRKEYPTERSQKKKITSGMSVVTEEQPLA